MKKSQELITQLNQLNKNTLMETLSINFIKGNYDSITAQMPVNEKVHQPYGLLHGGASVVLAETVGSTLSAINVDQKTEKAVGSQINSYHLRSLRSGIITATAQFIRKGRTTHLVEIEIFDQDQNKIHHSLLTNAIIKLRDD